MQIILEIRCILEWFRKISFSKMTFTFRQNETTYLPLNIYYNSKKRFFLDHPSNIPWHFEKKNQKCHDTKFFTNLLRGLPTLGAKEKGYSFINFFDRFIS